MQFVSINHCISGRKKVLYNKIDRLIVVAHIFIYATILNPNRVRPVLNQVQEQVR